LKSETLFKITSKFIAKLQENQPKSV